MSHHKRRLNRLAGIAAAVACTLLVSAPVPASAAPSVTTTGSSPGVGALPVDVSISSPPTGRYPAALKSVTGCRYREVLAPNGRAVRHIAPCQTGTGSGTGTDPWRSIATAMAVLAPGDVAYVHDGPAKIDYRESNLRPARDGTGPATRIRLMAAPGERPWIGSLPGRTDQSIMRLTRAWWVVQGLSFDAAGQSLPAPVVRVGSGAADTQAHHIVLQTISSRHASGPKSIVEFDGARNSALLDSIGSSRTGPIGLIEPLVGGRPQSPPANGSGNYTDHHAITVVNGADRILIRNNESAGHNGDSFQCGEGPTPTTNITVENNRFHQDEENAIDLKGCRGVTVRGNKMYGYRPARPYDLDGRLGSRSPHGDALVAHASTNAADRVLIELNRFWDNSRSINLAEGVSTATVRRNLVFDASTASCGIGAGLAIRSRNTEVYHNTLDGLAPLATVGCGDPWSVSEKHAIRVNPPPGSRVVLWNNAVSRASSPYAQSGSFDLDAVQNLFPTGARGLPAGSLTGDPSYVTDPANNDYYTRPGSPLRDAAAPVPAAVADPRPYCDDPSPDEPDLLVEPDIGFLESCS